jgi:hypothetical protein
VSESTIWPDLPLAAWSETCDTLHLWTQIVGKLRIALTPLVNHWWNATFLVTARGLVAPAMPYCGRTVDVIFDFATHRLVMETSDGRVEDFALEPMAVADFYSEFMRRLRRLGIPPAATNKSIKRRILKEMIAHRLSPKGDDAAPR